MMMRNSTLSLPGLVALAGLFTFAGCGNNEDNNTTGGAKNGVYCTDQMDEGKPLCEVYGNITEDTTLERGNVYLLKTGVFVGAETDAGEVTKTAKLTIQPGTLIKGDTATLSFLTVLRGSQLIAEGTADSPIVFTSAAPAGSRARGQWGGIILNGKAPINAADNSVPCPAKGEGGTGCYGGQSAEDSSGVLKYVRVEFAGNQITDKNELNGIAFQGVGSGTTVEHIQVHMNKDDGIEFFGGTVNAKWVVISGAGDDSIDWTYGWTGKLQYAAVIQYDDDADNGIEADNNGDNNAATPISMPVLSNITLVGSKDSSASDLGMLLREGTGAKIWNAVVVNFNEACVAVDQDETFKRLTDGDLVIKNSFVHCPTSVDFCDATKVGKDQSCATDGLDHAAVSGPYSAELSNRAEDPKLTDPANQTAPNMLPAADSPVLGAGAAVGDSWFDAVDYAGAFKDTDWTSGWTAYPAS